MMRFGRAPNLKEQDEQANQLRQVEARDIGAPIIIEFESDVQTELNYEN